MINEYDWWANALIGDVRELTLNKAECGFYRHQTREGWIPVAIYSDEVTGATIAKIGHRDPVAADERFCMDVFSRCCRHPVTDDAYWTVINGGLWPDAPPAIDKSNLPNESDYERLKAELEGERAEADLWLKQIGEVQTQEQADRAVNWANRIAEIEKRADETRDKEKRPFLEECRAVDQQWMPLVKAAAALKRKLKDAPVAFLSAERRRKEEERRRQVEEASAKGEPVIVDMRQPVRAKAGTLGHTAGLRTVKTAQVDDIEQALLFFKGHPKIVELVQQLANTSVRNGVTPPGCTLITSQQVA